LTVLKKEVKTMADLVLVLIQESVRIENILALLITDILAGNQLVEIYQLGERKEVQVCLPQEKTEKTVFLEEEVCI
jgi:hypothetical protein